MLQRDVRLGDDIDDFCIRCKRVMNHAVVSVISGVAAKVRCRTCHSDHDFRHEQPPPPKIDSRKAALFNEVLKTVDPSAAGVSLDGALDPDPSEAEAIEMEPDELEVLELGAPEAYEPAAAEAVAAAEPVAAKRPTAKPAAKTSAKGKSKAKK
jgi:hypothetical protein